jgi:hypothetical protein
MQSEYHHSAKTPAERRLRHCSACTGPAFARFAGVPERDKPRPATAEEMEFVDRQPGAKGRSEEQGVTPGAREGSVLNC